MTFGNEFPNLPKYSMNKTYTFFFFLIFSCGCEECVTSKEQDSLRHSQARINAYRALTSPSLICLSSRDPLLTAIELYGELKRLELMETEFRAEYNVNLLIAQCIFFISCYGDFRRKKKS